MSAIPYRKDIDGLRAVAVLLVVFSHAQFTLFKGGFIGVDIFFVISGYLITSIMVNEIDRGIFSFKRFYLRRIKRLLPALLLVLSSTSFLAHKMLMPYDLISYAKAQFATLAYCSNFFLWRYFGGYWRGFSKEFPLTHTWSLSVEEQFYAIWPALLLLAYTLIPKRFHTRILFFTFFPLLVLSQYLTKYPEFAFYMIPARFYEMFIGATAALLFRKPIALDKILEKYFVNICHIIGISLLLYAAFVYKGGLAYPGLNALVPCLGALLLLLPFRQNRSFVSVILSSPVFVGIGKISYSLYLWHWPIFSLLTFSGYSVEKYRYQALLLSFILSIFSYYCVEKPFRKANISFRKALFILVLLPIGLSSIYMKASLHDGFLSRYTGATRSAMQSYSMIDNSYLEAQLGKSSPTNSHKENKNTIWGYDRPEPISALLVGDSHSTAIRPFVELLCEPFGIKGLQVSRDSTPFLLNVDFFVSDVYGKPVLRKDKREMNNYWRQLIIDKKIKYVFIAAFYSSRIYFKSGFPEHMVHDRIEKNSDILADNKESFYLGLYDTVKFLVDNGVMPVIFKDAPYIETNLSKNYMKNLLFNSHLNTTYPWEKIINRHKFENVVIDKIKLEFPSVVVIDLKDILKNYVKNGQFSPVIDGIPLYADSNHLNSAGAKLLGEKWIARFGNPLRKVTKSKD
ncbi:acyltransferase family protein [Maridesulfovibrio sp.]|uniref:acyltransferase family protein n=1 Tax=Maridesulfovibrio sp. TaxID=2795000 RepID=UPI0039F0718E